MKLEFGEYHVSWKMEKNRTEVGIIKPSVEIGHGAITHFHLVYLNRDSWKLLLMGETCGDFEYGHLVTFHNLFEGTRTECVARALNWLKIRQEKLQRELDDAQFD